VTEKPDIIVTKAEVLFTGFIVEHNLSINVSEHTGALCRKMLNTHDQRQKHHISTRKNLLTNSLTCDYLQCMVLLAVANEHFIIYFAPRKHCLHFQKSTLKPQNRFRTPC
jgi:hypothetical protein